MPSPATPPRASICAGSCAEEGARPGAAALRALEELAIETPATLAAYIAGEQALPTQARRHLVGAGVPKERIVFTGYWRQGKAAL
ncbi:SIP domain-containing protein [Propioniciclava flava]